MKISLLAILCLSGCLQQIHPNHVSPNGISYYGTFDFDNTDLAEEAFIDGALSIKEYKAEDGQKFPSFGDRNEIVRKIHLVSIYEVKGSDNGSFYSVENHENVGGQTFCETFQIETNDRPSETGLVHELTHIIDHCAYDAKAPNPTHPFWSERGLARMIADIGGTLEYNYTHNLDGSLR